MTDAELNALFDAARSRLREAGAARVRLAARIPPRRVLGVMRGARLAPAAGAWHLGILLLTDDDVFAVGEVVRAADPEHRGFTSENQRRRAERGLEALRGGFAPGESVHFDWRTLDEAGILARRDGSWQLRWSPSGGWMPLGAYLDERVALRVSPPPSA